MKSDTEKTVKNSRSYYALRNKVLRNIEIFDFVIFRDGSYYSLFAGLDTSKDLMKTLERNDEFCFSKS